MELLSVLCENLENVLNTKHSESWESRVVTGVRNHIPSTVNILRIETQVTTLMMYGMEVSIPEG